MLIRFARAMDTAAILKIYAGYIHTPVTFECVLPDEQEFKKRIAEISAFYPCLVCEEEGHIIGFAYAHRHMEREAYQWNAELSVYLDPSFTSRGLGKKLYMMLIDMLKWQGIRTVYGCVTVPNEKSEALHKALGFRIVGTYQNAGYKMGKWRDVRWFEKTIAPYDASPGDIKPVSRIPEQELQKIYQSYGFPG